MPKYEVRIIKDEVVKSETFIVVDAFSEDEAMFRVEEMIDMGETCIDLDWNVISAEDNRYVSDLPAVQQK